MSEKLFAKKPFIDGKRERVNKGDEIDEGRYDDATLSHYKRLDMVCSESVPSEGGESVPSEGGESVPSEGGESVPSEGVEATPTVSKKSKK